MVRKRSTAAFRALTLGVLVSFATAAAAAPANVYDKFRKATYSNQGLVNEQDEMRLGSQVHDQVLRRYRLVDDPELVAYVQTVGERVARVSKRPDLGYRFFVVDDPSVNAFSIPGGFIYVNTGLLDIVQSEDELAAVMAHEVSHVVARHGLRNYKKAQRTSLWTGILGTAAVIATGGSVGGQAANAAAKMLGAGLLTRNSRDFEREADFLGVHDLARAGYRPEGMIRVFERLEQNKSKTESSIGGIFADHPDSRERIKNTRTEIEQHLGGRSPGQASARPRRAAQGQVDSGFADMKRLLASYRSGRRQYGTRRSSDPRDRGYDPDSRPVENNRPVLRRQPPPNR